MHANAKLQIFAPRVHEHVSEYIPIRDRQRFGTTSGLHLDNINAHSLTFTYMIVAERASHKKVKIQYY